MAQNNRKLESKSVINSLVQNILKKKNGNELVTSTH